MVRARLAGAALLAAALGLSSGCSTPSCGCPNESFGGRLTGLFRHRNTSADVIAPTIDGPVIVDPGPGVIPESSGFAPFPQTIQPPLVPPPQPLPGTEARRMPYQPQDK